MAHVVKDRVKETTTTTGVGTVTLLGAATGFQSFSTIGNGNTTFYVIVDANGTGWEVGIGTYNTGTLARTTILESSNANAAISLSVGVHTVFCGYPADKSIYLTPTGAFSTQVASGDFGASAQNYIMQKASGNGIVGISNIPSYTIMGNTLGISSLPSGINNLILGTPGYTAAAGTIAGQWTTNLPNYYQVSLQNTNASGSTDFVVTADNGNDSVHYADFGMNGSLSGGFPFINSNAAYLYTTDNELDIAALGTNGAINFYTNATPNLIMSISSGIYINNNPNGPIGALQITGKPFAGTNSTSIPLLYLNSGSTPGFNTGGTYFGINGHAGFGGNLMALYQNGGQVFTVNTVGTTIIPGTFQSTRALSTSVSAFLHNGTIFTTGSGLNTYPNFAFLDSGAGSTPIWSSGGTIFGANTASTFFGNFLDLRSNGGASLFNVASTGGTSVNSLNILNAGNPVAWSGRGKIFSPANAIIQLLDTNNAIFSGLVFGPFTNLGAAIYSSGTTLRVRSADNSFNGYFSAGSGTFDALTLNGNMSIPTNFNVSNGSYQIGINGASATYNAGSNNNQFAHAFVSNNQTQAANGPHEDFKHTMTFNPTAGNVQMIGMSLNYVVNQTGTASGAYSALKVNVTETSATGPTKFLFEGQQSSGTVFSVTSAGAISGTAHIGNGSGLTNISVNSIGADLQAYILAMAIAL